jgi:hypothetical protein
MSNVPSGLLTVRAMLAGFVTAQGAFEFDRRPRQLEIEMRVGTLAETITVAAESPDQRRVERRAVAIPPSSNIVDLQRRAAGVLPVRIDVPRAGTSHIFVKPLVVDQETTVKLRYKRKT